VTPGAHSLIIEINYGEEHEDSARRGDPESDLDRGGPKNYDRRQPEAIEELADSNADIEFCLAGGGYGIGSDPQWDTMDDEAPDSQGVLYVCTRYLCNKFRKLGIYAHEQDPAFATVIKKRKLRSFKN
jgi:hypothetical protein